MDVSGQLHVSAASIQGKQPLGPNAWEAGCAPVPDCEKGMDLLTPPTIEPRIRRSRIPLTGRYTDRSITILVCWQACPPPPPPSSKRNVLNTKNAAILIFASRCCCYGNLNPFLGVSTQKQTNKHGPSFVCLLHSSQSPSCLVIFKRADACFSWGDVIVTSLEHSLNYNVRCRLLTRTELARDSQATRT
jgi:hypothetical protein